MLKTVLLAAAALTFAGLAACSPKGSAEKAGEDMDSAIEESTQGEVNRGDGALEKTGEAIDRATGQKNDDVVDAAHDATDNDPKTKP